MPVLERNACVAISEELLRDSRVDLGVEGTKIRSSVHDIVIREVGKLYYNTNILGEFFQKFYGTIKIVGKVKDLTQHNMEQIIQSTVPCLLLKCMEKSDEAYQRAYDSYWQTSQETHLTIEGRVALKSCALLQPSHTHEVCS